MATLYCEMKKLPPSEITPEPLYLTRRRFMAGLGALAAGLLLDACVPAPGTAPATANAEPPAPVGSSKDELGNAPTPYDAVAGYNNYYEFSLDKEGVATPAKGFHTSPWQVEVTGLVNKGRTFSLDDLRKLGEEERIYRLRCVEAWSMVIPWLGLPLWKLLKLVEPKPEARYVRFVSVLRPDEMPGQKGGPFSWPYVEGLRLDEAMHDLAILATGLYGKPLPAQNGAPVRLVVPWKYGFKSSKAIVRIELVAEPPVTFWMAQGPGEYGFYANVNPEVPHPRWSQAAERRIGETGRRATLMFNGYEEQVAALYKGMDLKVDF